MNSRLRLTCGTAAVALAAAATLGAAPAQAQGKHFSYPKHTTKRSTSTTSGRTSLGASSTTSTTAVPVSRLAGTDRIDTAIKSSQMAWSDSGSATGAVAKAVVLSRYDEYADALGGSALAGAAEAPLLMTPPTSLDTKVKAEIDRVLGGSGTVYVLGGTGAISDGVLSALQAAGYTPVRLAGVDRYDTSVEVAKQVGKLAPGGAPAFVFATTGLNFPDGLAAGATAGGLWASVVLTRDNTVTPSVQTYLDGLHTTGVQEFAVGGAAANVARTWDYVYSGSDRFATAASVAEGFWADPSTPNDNPVAMGLATGLNWPDALAGGAFMATLGPLVLSQTDSLPSATTTVTQEIVASATPSPVQAGYIFGGTSVVGPNAESQFTTLLNG